MATITNTEPNGVKPMKSIVTFLLAAFALGDDEREAVEALDRNVDRAERSKGRVVGERDRERQLRSSDSHPSCGSFCL